MDRVSGEVEERVEEEIREILLVEDPEELKRDSIVVVAAPEEKIQKALGEKHGVAKTMKKQSIQRICKAGG
jgi:hypothetical protein